jgi:hypothetical protein
MELTFPTVQGLRSTPATLEKNLVRYRIEYFLRSAVFPPVKAAFLSRERPAISRFLAFA